MRSCDKLLGLKFERSNPARTAGLTKDNLVPSRDRASVVVGRYPTGPVRASFIYHIFNKEWKLILGWRTWHTIFFFWNQHGLRMINCIKK